MNYESSIRADGSEPIDVAAREDLVEDRRAGRFALNRRTLIIAIIAIIGALALLYFLFAGEQTPAGADQDENAPVVSVVAPGRVTVEGAIRTTGTLGARRDIAVGVEGEGGRVVSVGAEAGDWVNAGQVLVSINRSVQNQQARAAAAQIEVARADLNLAQANLDRSLKLVDRGFVSDADVDRLTATRDAARSRVSVAQAQLSELRARNARLNIVAPASGLVLERMVETGQIVGPGSGPLYRIARGGEMELLAEMSETDLSRISTGVSAEVTPVGSDRSFTGQVWQIAPLIDQQNRQGTARIALPYDRALRPGGFANATIRSGTVVAPVLPESAVLSDDAGAFVYIVDGDNKIVRRDITTGMVTPQGIVIADGLSGSERVVLRSGGFRTVGETVRPELTKE